MGDNRDSEKVNIVSGNINDQPLVIKRGIVLGFDLKKNNRYVIKCKVGREDMFASKVELYANPK